MTIASVVVEVMPGASAAVLGMLAAIRSLSVYGVKENQIVTVIESGTTDAVEDILKQVQTFKEVTGVYPVFIGDDE